MELLSESYHLRLEELRCPIFVYGDAIFALPGTFSLVATQFLRYQFLFFSSLQYVPSVPLLMLAESISFRIGHPE